MDAWERLRAREFWRWAFEGDVSFDEELSFELALPCGSGRGLKAVIDEGTSITLGDLESGAELGWLDDAHFHPNCLRPMEALHVARMQSAPDQRRLALLLLLPFAVVTSDDEGEALERAAQDAWEAQDFDGACPGLGLAEFRDARVEWYRDEERRWWLRQSAATLDLRPLYSLRVEQNPGFPAWLSAVTDD